MTQKRWFLGLDGGGSKTHCVLYDLQTDTLTAMCGGPTNHEALEHGMEDLPQAIMALVTPLLAQAGIGIEDLSSAAFGMGGVDTPIQHDIISGILRELGFQSFVLSNDAYLGIKAECDGYGICAVNGSGYSVVGISPTGESLQIGGHGDMSGDRGGGCYLVPAVIRAAYAQQFKLGPQTRLTQMLYDWLGISRREEFPQAVAMRILADAAQAYREISRLLYTAAAEHDPVALGILTESGEDYALSIQSVAGSLAIPAPIPLVLVGSQFVKGECSRTIDAMRQALEKTGVYSIRLISTAPVAGALFWAMELADCLPDANTRDALKLRLRHPERSQL